MEAPTPAFACIVFAGVKQWRHLYFHIIVLLVLYIVTDNVKIKIVLK